MSGVRRGAALLRHGLVMELAVYRSLARWLVRRPDVPDGATPIGYARLVTPVLCLWIGASAAEVPLVDVLLPWEGLRLPLLALGVWGLLWMLGLLAAYRTRPHLLLDGTLLLRGGLLTEVAVPLDAVTAVAPGERDLPSSMRSLAVVDDALLVGVSGRTNLQLTLHEPMLLATPRDEVLVDRVGAWVDEPREVAALLRRRLTAPSP